MKTSTKVGIFFAGLSVLAIIIGVVFAKMNSDTRTMQENILIVKQAYTAFSVGVVDNYQYRAELNTKLNEVTPDNYVSIYEYVIGSMKNYNNTMVTIKNNVDLLEDKCSMGYEDHQTNVFCENYQQLYESVNNEYVTNVNKYNSKIEEYNSTNETDYALFELVSKEYIDFNGDGIYNSKPTE